MVRIGLRSREASRKVAFQACCYSASKGMFKDNGKKEAQIESFCQI